MLRSAVWLLGRLSPALTGAGIHWDMCVSRLAGKGAQYWVRHLIKGKSLKRDAVEENAIGWAGDRLDSCLP